MTLRLTGFSKRENKEVTLILFDGRIWSQDYINDFFDADQVVQLREYGSGVLIEELKVKDLQEKNK